MQHALNVSLGMEFSSTEYSDTRNAYTLNSGHGPGTLLALNVGASLLQHRTLGLLYVGSSSPLQSTQAGQLIHHRIVTVIARRGRHRTIPIDLLLENCLLQHLEESQNHHILAHIQSMWCHRAFHRPFPRARHT